MRSGASTSTRPSAMYSKSSTGNPLVPRAGAGPSGHSGDHRCVADEAAHQGYDVTPNATIFARSAMHSQLEDLSLLACMLSDPNADPQLFSLLEQPLLCGRADPADDPSAAVLCGQTVPYVHLGRGRDAGLSRRHPGRLSAHPQRIPLCESAAGLSDRAVPLSEDDLSLFPGQLEEPGPAR